MPTQHATKRAEKPVMTPEPPDEQTAPSRERCERCAALLAIVEQLARCSAEAGAWSLTFRAPPSMDVVALIAQAQQVVRETSE